MSQVRDNLRIKIQLSYQFVHPGMSHPGFSSAQRSLRVVRNVGLLGNVIGVAIGCTLGLVNLLLIDVERSKTLKLQSELTEDQKFAFEIEASNRDRIDATTVRVRGPDVDGILASMATALNKYGCSIEQNYANSTRSNNDGHEDSFLDDTFVVTKWDGVRKGQVSDEDLDDLARAVLDSTRHPISIHSIQLKVKTLEDLNMDLEQEVEKLEKLLEDRQITLVKKNKEKTNDCD